jgi:hypothetical protein
MNDSGRRWSGLDWVAIVLVVIGALNWGLVGLFKFDLVAAVFGGLSALSRIIYVVVAIAGLYLLSVAIKYQHDTHVHPPGRV